MRVVAEHLVRQEYLAVPLGVYLFRAVNHDLGNGRVIQERLYRPVSGDLVDHVFNDAAPDPKRQGNPFFGEDSGGHLVYFLRHCSVVELTELHRIRIINQPFMDPAFQ